MSIYQILIYTYNIKMGNIGSVRAEKVAKPKKDVIEMGAGRARAMEFWALIKVNKEMWM